MCDGTALASDQPLHDDACWFRTLTNEDHVTRAGTLHYQALKGSQFGPSDAGKSWDHELSGRVLCMAGNAEDIINDGQSRISAIAANYEARNQRMPSKIRFVGIASGNSTSLRTNVGQVKVDCVYTPTNDVAHSDVVTFGTSSDEDLDPVRNWLKINLQVTLTANITALISSV